MKSVILSVEGLEKVKQELDELKKKRRPAVIERLRASRALGDLSENSEYDDARNEQSFVEGRIEELQEMIKHAKVVSKKESNGSVGLGSVVTCKIDGEIEQYQLVSSIEADLGKGKLSIDSPFGKALINKKKGDIVEVNAPAGKISYQITEVK